LGVRLVENALDDLLLFGVQDLGQVLVELGLLLLKGCTTLVDVLAAQKSEGTY